MTANEAMQLVLSRFGFIVIGWDPTTGDLNVGDDPVHIWGNAPPQPFRVSGKSSQKEWVAQNRFLLSKGQRMPDHAFNPPAGQRYSRVVTD